MIPTPSGLAHPAFAPQAFVATASQPIDEAVTVIRDSPVYVAPGTEDTDNDTAGILLNQLYNDDNLVIVMLPAGESVLSSGELLSLARKIDTSLEGDRIIGLSVGDQIIAYSASLPPGEATDLMERAINVSANTPEALSTFIRNVHSWQAANPKAVASQPVKQSDSDISMPLLFGSSGLLLAVSIITALLVRYRARYKQSSDHVKIKAAPDPVKDVLEPILKLRSRINDPALRDLVTQMCSDTEAYFKRNITRKGDTRRNDADEFEMHLRSMQSVLERYVDVQDNPRFFHNPPELMEQGAEAVTGFSEFVLTNVRRGSREALTNYRVDTDILAAQRYR